MLHAWLRTGEVLCYLNAQRVSDIKENFNMKEHHEHILQSIAVATIILIVSFVVSVLPVHAQTFPSDARSVHFESLINTANVSVLASTTKRTLLYVGIDTDGTNSQGGLWCGSTHIDGVNDVLETHSSPANTGYFMAYHCDGVPLTASFSSIGAKGGHIFYTYVDRDTTTTRDPLDSFSTSTNPLFVQDAGNLSFLLTILISLMFLMVVGFVYNNMTNKKPWH